MPNDLIAVDNSVNPPRVRLYIQFVPDAYANRGLPYFLPGGSLAYKSGALFYQDIRNEFVKYASCLGFNIKFNLVPTTTGTGSFGANCLDWRFPNIPNPFERGPNPATPPPAVMWSEQNAQGGVVYPEIKLPLVQFYLGDGQSLNQDFRFRNLNNPYPDLTEAQARNRVALNRNTNYSQVIPGFEKEYSTQTSFFNRKIRAGYLFTDGRGLLPVTFMHELGHVLGLDDRYVKGIDEATAADNILNYVGRPAKSDPPLSKQHVNRVLNCGAPGPDIDTDYDPQNNLMSSRSYRLSTYQKSIISGALVENEFDDPYVKDDVVVLLSQNAAARRPAGSVPADEPQPNSPPGTCRKTETNYFPSAVAPTPGGGPDRATFVRADGSTGNHNAFFKTAPGPLLRVRYDGDTGVLVKLMKGLAPINGAETLMMVYNLLGL